MGTPKSIAEQLADQSAEWEGGKIIEHDPMIGDAESVIRGIEVGERFLKIQCDHGLVEMSLDSLAYGAAPDGGLKIIGFAGAMVISMWKPEKKEEE